jgi:hypothetical protein
MMACLGTTFSRIATFKKLHKLAGCRCLTLVILATLEAEIEMITV